jgi:hypothetical protein
MNQYLKILLFGLLVFIGCEQSDDGLELIYSSINDGEILDNYGGGVFLKFSREISNEEFNAVSIDNDFRYFAEHLGVLHWYGLVIENMYFVESSNYIQLNNQPQTFIYDSNHKSCLLIEITDGVSFHGTGEGFVPNIGANTLKIGDNEIDFTISTTNDITCTPNPYKLSSPFETNLDDRLLTFITDGITDGIIIDIYETNSDGHIKRLFTDDQSRYCGWDMTNFDNEEVISGIYAYKVGTDTTYNGYLNSYTESYFSIIKSDE